jgi:hypothetical protein
MKMSGTSILAGDDHERAAFNARTIGNTFAKLEALILQANLHH